MANPFFTIGHSTHPIEQFMAMLEATQVKLVADVRTVPRSRFNPQFNRDALAGSLAASGVAYEHLASLGGLRKPQRDVPPETNAFWENASFRNYADYALGEDFRLGLRRLRELGHETRSCIMCAEAVWWRCHRRIIADHLIAAGEEVVHILGEGHIEPAHMTPTARIRSDRTLTYPKDTPPLLARLDEPA